MAKTPFMGAALRSLGVGLLDVVEARTATLKLLHQGRRFSQQTSNGLQSLRSQRGADDDDTVSEKFLAGL